MWTGYEKRIDKVVSKPDCMDLQSMPIKIEHNNKLKFTDIVKTDCKPARSDKNQKSIKSKRIVNVLTLTNDSV